MVRSQHISIKFLNKTVKCAICHNDINDLSLVYQPQFNLGVICMECRQCFSSEDIRSILELFLVYGGYFGQLREQDFSLMKELETINNSCSNNKNFSMDDLILEINSRLLHKALLHGIHPEDYIRCLKKLLNNTHCDYF